MAIWTAIKWRCKKHPHYQGVKKPDTDVQGNSRCNDCTVIYEMRHEPKLFQGEFGGMVAEINILDKR